MSYLPDGVPAPHASPDDAAYWDYCNKRELRVQRCTSCGHFRHPPMPNCPECRSAKTEWAKVSGEGTVFTYTIAWHPVHPALKGTTPYNIAVVMLDDADEVRLVSNVIDAEPDEMRIGMPVSLVWETVTGGVYVPRFRKRAGAEA